MSVLRNREYAQLLDLVVAALDSQENDPPWPLITHAVQDLVGGTAAMIDEFRADEHHILAWTHGPTYSIAKRKARDLASEHPLAASFAAGARSPLRTSDVTDARSWRRTRAYAETRVLLDGRVHHLGIPLPPPLSGGVRVLLVARARQDFPDRALEVSSHAQRLVARLSRSAAGPISAGVDSRGLTDRELTVLRLLAQGGTAAAIGRQIGIARATVSKHQENIYRKLGTHDRLTTVLAAQRAGLLRGYAAERSSR